MPSPHESTGSRMFCVRLPNELLALLERRVGRKKGTRAAGKSAIVRRLLAHELGRPDLADVDAGVRPRTRAAP